MQTFQSILMRPSLALDWQPEKITSIASSDLSGWYEDQQLLQ